MPNLTDKEKEILQQAYEIKERIKAEQLEAGEISMEEAKSRENDMYKKPDSQKPEGRKPEKSKAAEAVKKKAGSSKEAPQRAKPKEKGQNNVRSEKKTETLREKQPASRKAKKKSSNRFLKKLGIIAAVIIVIIVIILIGVLLFVKNTVSAMNYKPYETSYVRADDVLYEKGVKNILLIGTDNRAEGDDCSRSDAMVIISVNSKKRKLVMTSILRDSYVTIPGYGQNRINEAYQYGGPALLIQTIEQNYKISVDNYIQVDFFNFVDVIDAFGGVKVNVMQEELQYIDGYISEYNHIVGDPEGDGFLGELDFGEQNLTGKQALGYSRIRYIGTDFMRTERQRTVLNALFEKIKKSDPFTILKAVKLIIPDLTTNISSDEMTKLIMCAPAYLTYNVVTARVPADGTWSNAIMGANQEVLAVDFGANKDYLKSQIYD